MVHPDVDTRSQAGGLRVGGAREGGGPRQRPLRHGRSTPDPQRRRHRVGAIGRRQGVQLRRGAHHLQRERAALRRGFGLPRTEVRLVGALQVVHGRWCGGEEPVKALLRSNRRAVLVDLRHGGRQGCADGGRLLRAERARLLPLMPCTRPKTTHLGEVLKVQRGQEATRALADRGLQPGRLAHRRRHAWLLACLFLGLHPPNNA
mmetsp:Transcript_9401/g.27607  ORF Transcript_9401/g.27607 Transcript_9401/m.27607 type:complete len:204 (+) Transcript_9401:264-875(+)